MFLTGWRQAVADSPIAASDDPSLLRLFVLEKALYEITYEINNRPDWLDIPLRGLLALS